jgi:hypothetical protein
MKKSQSFNRLTATLICAIAAVLFCVGCASPGKNAATPKNKCMFIGAPTGAENAEFDQYIIPLLKSWGYQVTVYYSTNIPKLTAKDYAPYDFIFLSETTHSRDMAPLKGIAKPMLCSDGWAAKESALAFGKGEPVGILEPARPVVFLKEAMKHPLAAGYTPGTVVELGAVKGPKPCLIVWGKPTIPVIPIAGVATDPSRLVVYGIEKGTRNASGDLIQNRVAVVGIHAWGYDDLTEAGKKMFQAGIEWILSEP